MLPQRPSVSPPPAPAPAHPPAPPALPSPALPLLRVPLLKRGTQVFSSGIRGSDRDGDAAQQVRRGPFNHVAPYIKGSTLPCFINREAGWRAWSHAFRELHSLPYSPCYPPTSLSRPLCVLQVQQCLSRLSSSLLSHGLSLDDVAFVHLYLSCMADFAHVNAAYCHSFGDHPPSRSCIEAPLPAGCKVKLWHQQVGEKTSPFRIGCLGLQSVLRRRLIGLRSRRRLMICMYRLVTCVDEGAAGRGGDRGQWAADAAGQLYHPQGTITIPPPSSLPTCTYNT